jgi:hypothetical protein
MTNLQKGLVGHWTMDDDDTGGGTLYDRSAYDNHGIINSGATSGFSGIVSDSFSFDGTSSAFIGTDLFYETTNLTQVTVSAWYKTTSTDEHMIASSDRNEYWRLGVGTDGANGIQWTVSSSDMVSAASKSSLQDGNWHHIVGFFDASLTNDHKIYIDEELDSEQNFFNSGIGSNNVSYTHIGIGSEASVKNGNTGPDDTMIGELDDVRVYHRGISSDEVSALYNMRSQRSQTSNLERGLIGHWTMDDDDTSGGKLYDDSAYGNHGTINGPTTSQSSIIGESYEFNGSSDYIQTPLTGDTANSAYSISVWFNLNSFNSDEIFVGNYDSNGMLARIEETDEFDLWHDSDSIEGGSVELNEWTHAVYTYDGSNAAIYKNTKEVASGSIPNNSNSANLRIGDTYDNRYYDGKMSNVRIYNRVLSKEEINRLYNNRQ